MTLTVIAFMLNLFLAGYYLSGKQPFLGSLWLGIALLQFARIIMYAM